MDEAVQAVIAEYDARIESEKTVMANLGPDAFRRRDEFLLSVGQDSAVFLNTLAKSLKAKSILEIGTSYGYSTVWLAEAAKANGGKVTTLELAKEKSAYAKTMVTKAKLQNHVDFQQGDARELLKTLSGPFDFVLIDLWKELYIPCFDLTYPKLADGAVVIADNMLDPPMWIEEANAYRRHARAKSNIDSVLLPIGSGIEVSRVRNQPV